MNSYNNKEKIVFENIKDFDVREFYVQLVADLRSKGF